MTPEAYCQAQVAQSGSSFYYSFLFLPQERRQAITALYAFCRAADDAVDDCEDLTVAAQTLAWWRTEISRLFAGQAQHPATQALQPYLAKFDLQRQYFDAILDGMEMDLQQSRYLDFASLQQYCYRVAGVVGILSAHIFGYTDPATLRYAEKLGLALQLTNIIRDVGDDARKGRIYLPVTELQQFSVPASDIMQRRYSPAFTALMQFQAERAQKLFNEALALLPKQDRRAQRAGLMMATIYRTLLDEITHSEFQVLHQKIGLTPLRKFWLAWKTWLKSA